MNNQKGAILATIFVGILGAAVSLYIHFSGSDESSKDVLGTESISVVTEKNKDNTKEITTYPRLNINDVFVTPVDTKSPSTFYVELKNNGSVSAENFEVKVDFGESLINTCEWLPENIAHNNSEEGNSLQLKVSSLNENESLYIICGLNIPYFKQLLVTGGNTSLDKYLSYEGYKEMRNGEEISFYENLWRFLLGSLLALFIFRVFISITSN